MCLFLCVVCVDKFRCLWTPEALGPLGAGVSHLTRVLGTKLGPSARTVKVLNL